MATLPGSGRNEKSVDDYEEPDSYATRQRGFLTLYMYMSLREVTIPTQIAHISE